MNILYEMRKCAEGIMVIAKDIEAKHGRLTSVSLQYKPDIVGRGIEEKANELIALGQQMKKLAKEFAKQK